MKKYGIAAILFGLAFTSICKCGNHTPTLIRQYNFNKRIIREYGCNQCGRRFTTVESRTLFRRA